ALLDLAAATGDRELGAGRVALRLAGRGSDRDRFDTATRRPEPTDVLRDQVVVLRRGQELRNETVGGAVGEKLQNRRFERDQVEVSSTDGRILGQGNGLRGRVVGRRFAGFVFAHRTKSKPRGAESCIRDDYIPPLAGY